MLVIDGSVGESGEQVLRSALTLSMVTRRPFRMERIRSGRGLPGLTPTLIDAVHAAVAVCNAEVSGDVPGSTSLSFRPRAIRGGAHALTLASGGSTTLVLEMLAPALLRATEPTRLRLEGGTHAPGGPSHEFVALAWVEAMRAMGASIDVTLEQPGFGHPGAPRGVLSAVVQPGAIGRFEREVRGPERTRRASVLAAGIAESVVERELRIARERLGLARDHLRRITLDPSLGPGNVFTVEFEHAAGTSVFVSFGERALRPEQVAELAIGRALAFHESDAAVEAHLASQLLLPMAIGKGGVFTTTEPSPRATAQIALLERFVEVDVDLTTRDERTFTLEIRGADV